MKKNRWNVPIRGNCFQKVWLMAKLLTVFLFVMSMNVSASLYSQSKTVSLKLSDATLEEVIQSLKLQTDYGFFYNIDNKDIKSVKNISIDVKDMSLEDVLLQVLKGTNLTYSIVNNVVILNTKNPVVTRDSVQKEHVLVGKVVDQKKEPIPGVTVRLKNTNIGTATNNKGTFVFRLPITKGALVFSFVGFKTKETEFKLPSDTLHITLEEDLASIDEVTVVAYGERKKREVVGAISSVKADDIKEVPTASIENLLQGRMAGVEINTQSGAPGGGGSVVAIRGYNSLFVGDGRDYGEPLYVIDGVPVHSFTSPITGTNALAEIDPSTIESVEVLKDAASAAIYGSRAGNGVILITTKKGKAGRASFSANVSYSYSILPETPVQTGGRAERVYKFDLSKNEHMAGYNNGGYVFPGGYEDAKGGVGGVYDRWWLNAMSNISGQRQLQDSLNPYYNNSTDWFRYAFRAGKIVNANIQASGGSEKMNYLVGAGYYTEEGIMYGSDFSRVNLIANLGVQPAPNLTLDTRLYLAYTDRSRGAGASGTMSGSKIERLTVDPKETSSLLAAGGINEEKLLEELNSSIEKNESYRLRANMNLKYQLYKGLNLSVLGSLDYNQGMRNNFRPSTLDPENNLSSSIGEVDRNMLLLNENMLTYRASFNEKHNIDALFGISYQSDQNDYISAKGLGGASDKIHYIVDEGTSVEINGQTVYLKEAKTNRTEKVLVSYYARLAYNYMQRYLFEATWRKDGSSVFGSDVRWATFPSAAIGWAFSEESFLENLSWLNFGKIRVSWGRSGQQFGQPYLAHGVMSPASTFLGQTTISPAPMGGMINRRLTWEESDQYDFGLDMDMFDYRVKFKLDYYYKLTKGLLYAVPLGGNWNFMVHQWQNAMRVSNEGLELELEADIFRETAVSWRMKFNISRNWNLLKKSYTGRDVEQYIIGRPLYSIFLYEDDGYYQTDDDIPYVYDQRGYKHKMYVGANGSGNAATRYEAGTRKILDIDGDGMIGTGDAVYQGSALPLAYGGWVNEIKWKGFEVNILFTYSLGRKMYRTYNVKSLQAGVSYPVLENVNKVSFWEKEGDITDYPRKAAYQGSLQQYSGLLASNLEKVNYIKLKQFTIGYDVPKPIVKKLKLSGIRLFFTGENLFTLTNYSGLDPEVVDMYSGMDDFNYYPLARKMSLGLTVNF